MYLLLTVALVEVGSTNLCQFPYDEELIVDHLYAIPLPPEYWNYVTWWTGSGWQWSVVT